MSAGTTKAIAISSSRSVVPDLARMAPAYPPTAMKAGTMNDSSPIRSMM